MLLLVLPPADAHTNQRETERDALARRVSILQECHCLSKLCKSGRFQKLHRKGEMEKKGKVPRDEKQQNLRA
jgi:hypothetical protein